MSSKGETFLTGANAIYMAHLYARYLDNPSSVDASWAHYFQNLDGDQRAALSDAYGASWNPRKPIEMDEEKPAASKDAKGKGDKAESKTAAVNPDDLASAIKVERLIESYKNFGHRAAKTDPLGFNAPAGHPSLTLESHGLSAADLSKSFVVLERGQVVSKPLSNIVAGLEALYCGNIGFEFNHVTDVSARNWLEEQIANIGERRQSDPASRKKIYERLVRAENFERFLSVKFTGAKRFGLEGGESLIVALEAMLEKATTLDVSEVVIGMAHRGRLSVLTNVVGKPYKLLFQEFLYGPKLPDGTPGSSDVKYHLGSSTTRQYNGKDIYVNLMPNPSHLEAVNPVVMGKVRAIQDTVSDKQGDKSFGVLLHGDAAFIGQGIVAEGFLLSGLEGYNTGGIIHIATNNQVGFTTSPCYSRASAYCSDLAKTIEAPVLHVNGDDPEAVAFCMTLATQFRQIFKRDIVVDIVCFRKNGHNEVDEPSFTQPTMYAVIAKHKSVKTSYGETLIAQNVMSEAERDAVNKTYDALLQKEFEDAQNKPSFDADWLKRKWTSLKFDREKNQPKTAITKAQFESLSTKLTVVPEGFTLHPRLQRLVEQKRHGFESGEGFDWGMGEALAFASLLAEKTPIRMSGQDAERGTFSHRHAVWNDYNNGAKHNAFLHLDKNQAFFHLYNSPLSEAAVLGFELGYSYTAPEALTIWEAQFGDFSNGAQIIIDQFISSAAAKWLRLSGLVMLLPHGYEGQGPEHSSARLERYLQLCAEDNMYVANITTPANYFHALRRQVKSQTRRPLIVMSPKSLLRLKEASSSTKDFIGDTCFQPVIGDDSVKASDVKRVVLCSGKVYYDLLAERTKKDIKNVALVRLEQLYPFEEDQVVSILKNFKGAQVVWCQEEPENMGAWHYIDRKLESAALKANLSRPVYVGRSEAASPATGLGSIHEKEQMSLVASALQLK